MILDSLVLDLCMGIEVLGYCIDPYTVLSAVGIGTLWVVLTLPVFHPEHTTQSDCGRRYHRCGSCHQLFKALLHDTTCPDCGGAAFCTYTRGECA